MNIRMEDMPYRRVVYEDVEKRYLALIEEMRTASDGAACLEAIRKRSLLSDGMTSMSLCTLRHDMDVNDAFYAKEQDYYDEIAPKLTDLGNRFDRAMLESPFLEEIEKEVGGQAIIMTRLSQECFDSRLIPMAQEENAVMSRYNYLTSNAVAEWNGGQVKRSMMRPYSQSADRETRRLAHLAVSASWEKQRDEVEALYARLVENRTRQARAMGLNSYTELSYRLMCRIGYGPEDVRRFREAVKRAVVPLHEKLEERRRLRLGPDKLRGYDNGICFKNGKPKPLGNTAASLEATRKMYTMMSPETAEFVGFLLDNGLYDVDIRDGKRDGGYMMYLDQYRAPFIFANFDGTSENAYIMCHEGGHAFQAYLKRNETLRERRGYTSEAAETHAMAMEFFAWPYMELFFGERAEDYRTMHLEGAVSLIVYECQQDEFQQLVYDHPEMTPAERNRLWAELNRAYFPGRDDSGDQNKTAGCGWQRIPHMFQWPFYAIDYALAQVCALGYLRWAREDRESAWRSYLSFCRETGSVSFPELAKRSGLGDPFDERTLISLADWLGENV